MRPHGLQIRGVDEVHLHAVAGHAVVQQGKSAAVEGGVGQNMLACGGDGPQAGGDGAHAGGGGHAGFAALQCSHLGLQHGGGGVAQTGVDVARFLAGKTASALLAAVKYKCGGLENGRGQRAVLRVLHIAGVDGFGAETAVFIQHGIVLLIIYGDLCSAEEQNLCL